MDDVNGSPLLTNHHHSSNHPRNVQHQVNHISDSPHHHAPQTRIAELQEEYLIPMKEDLSDWLKAIMDIDDIDANNFMSKLDNGVIVCKLAKLIEEKCDIDEKKLASIDSQNNNCNSPFKQNNNLSNNLNDNNHQSNNNNNINNTSDIKANNTTSNNVDMILRNNFFNNRSNSLKLTSNGDQGQYRSNSYYQNGRRLSFNHGGPLNGHSPVNGTPASNGICARTMKCWENAKSETFYARDNVSNFIKWCRKLNVRECVLFESEDLVLHNNPKNVVLCLLEVARIACKKFMFTPAPGLVQFEQEIDAEEKAELEREMLRRRKRLQSMKMQAKSANNKTPLTTIHSYNNNNQTNNVIDDKTSINCNSTNDTVTLKNNLNSEDDNNELHNNNNNVNHNLILGYEDNETNSSDDTDNLDKCSERPDSGDLTGGQSSDTGSINTGDDGVDGWSSVSQENLGRASSVTSISSTSAESTETSSQTPFGQESEKVVSQLDQKVMLIAKSYYGKKAKHGIQRLAEGKYRIAGKIVFVRLLKDRHVMVRVGGGWDTLQHFLERHGNGSDPVKEISPSDLLPMDTRPSESMSRRRNSQSSQQSVPSTPILRRCLSSTPVSRSSLSSPEPWTSLGGGNSSAGGSPNGSSPHYNGLPNGCSPYGHRSLARRSSASTTLSNITTASSSTTHSSTSSSSSTLNSTDKCVSPVVSHTSNQHNPHSSVTRRRSLAYDGSNSRNSPIKPNRSLLSLNLTRSPSTSSYLNSSLSSRHFNNSSCNLNNITNGNNTNNNSPTTKTSRYPNYLQSSQHITSKSSPSNSHHIKSPVTPSTKPSTPTSGNTPIRRTSLRAF
ncbi:probable serine/threonine-protein kinase DDB_G0282963 [Tetranychus urticae]|nr:probable serine/threonine-protein kinase DDB_G0282963 [Tetranychus urticae]